MSPELVTAIKDRIIGGQTKEEIRLAVVSIGHTEAAFEAAYKEAVGTPSGTTVVATETPLPSVFTLFEDGIRFAISRIDIVAYVLVPALLFFGCSYVLEHGELTGGLLIGVTALTILTFVVYLLATLVVFYMVTRDGKVTFDQSLAWARHNILSLAWVSVIMGLVVLGGFLLLIIPALVLLVTLYFSQYAAVLEEKRGMDALIRSRSLVSGRFFAVAAKLVGFGLCLLIPVFIGGVLFGMASSYIPPLPVSWIDDVLLEGVSAFLMVVSIRGLVGLYHALQIGRPAEQETGSRVVYWILGGLGVAAVLAFALSLYFMRDFYSQAESNSLESLIEPDTAALQADIHGATLLAAQYALTHGGSFEGVCAELAPSITAGEEVECNDTEDQWAVSGRVGEDRLCADTTTFAKKISSPLLERVECLVLPAPVEIPAVAPTSTASST